LTHVNDGPRARNGRQRRAGTAAKRRLKFPEESISKP